MKNILLGVAILFAIIMISFVMRNKRGKQRYATMNQLIKDEMPNGKRVIMTTNMEKSEVDIAIEDFIKINADGGSPPVERPQIEEREENVFLLYFSASTSYDLLCYWVNYIVYSNKRKRYNNNVTGWYEVASPSKGVWQPFANQKLMLYVPDTDKEYDNVYITTETNDCYKQEFAYDAPLIHLTTLKRKYSNIP
ncbi:MAG: hypothetical protein U0L04_02715 [Bacteroidaceae bacterium]|jgi:hypothetical protein|nr:hypothetical protein [Bacteroidaceae bacterium]MBQ5740898.1 hypothetical protein [Bacteroidaceae bacterium]MBR5481255.1 hypothetical protein [Bacteroidaceae bacterium]MEE1213870.1 hypothetical protein [Bacteroidaceae bacterium]